MSAQEYKHIRVRPEAYESLVSEAERRYTSKNDVTWSALIEQLCEEAQNTGTVEEPTIQYEV